MVSFIRELFGYLTHDTTAEAPTREQQQRIDAINRTDLRGIVPSYNHHVNSRYIAMGYANMKIQIVMSQKSTVEKVDAQKHKLD